VLGHKTRDEGRADLDTVDLRIVETLRHDPRSTNRAIAGQVGISEASVGVRIRRLVEDGDIQIVGYQNLAHLGYDKTIHVDCFVEPGRTEEVAKALSRSLRLDVVVILCGTPQIMVVFLARDDVDALEVIFSEIESVDGIARLETNVASTASKAINEAIPVSAPVEVDDIDRQIISLLSSDGRLGNRELGRRVGIAEATTRSRIQRLQQSAGLRYRLMIHHRFARHLASAYVAICTDRGKAKHVAEKIAQCHACFFSAVTLGRYSVFCHVLTASRSELYATIQSEIEIVDGVSEIGVREVLHVVKHAGQIGSTLDD
jgi:Lrp/AsnC family transcriptional regulator for asnA, asnC and gidA